MIVKDQMHRIIEVNEPLKRIVSIVPSQSELLWDLGLEKELVGITKFCIHPHRMATSVTLVGGTKKLNLDKIRKLQPDIIIANKEENEQSQIEELAKEFPVWISDIHNLDESLQMIEMLGDLFNKKEKALELITNIKSTFQQLTASTTKKVVYFIWNDPLMVAGKNTFIDDMLKRCNFENVFINKDSRYPEIFIEELQNANPELILLSSEPFPFKEKHVKEFQKHLPNTKIMIVDGELFSWYGSRLQHSANYFIELQKSLQA
jgi:ABC-type Fe3+-hydroxamate transport system substrate-binding protein